MPVRPLLFSLLVPLIATSVAAQGAPSTPASPATPTGLTKAHICMAPSSVETAGQSAADAIAAVQGQFASYLTGPTLEVAPLASRLPDQARIEAKGDNCPYVLFTTLKQVHKSGGGGGGLLGRVAGGAVQQGAYAAGSDVSSTGARVAMNASAGAAGSAASYSGSTQAKDELTLTTHLEAGDGTVLVDMTDKRKADSNGEDLLTPLVEKAATAVAEAVAKRGK